MTLSGESHDITITKYWARSHMMLMPPGNIDIQTSSYWHPALDFGRLFANNKGLGIRFCKHSLAMVGHNSIWNNCCFQMSILTWSQKWNRCLCCFQINFMFLCLSCARCRFQVSSQKMKHDGDPKQANNQNYIRHVEILRSIFEPHDPTFETHITK